MKGEMIFLGVCVYGAVVLFFLAVLGFNRTREQEFDSEEYPERVRNKESSDSILQPRPENTEIRPQQHGSHLTIFGRSSD